MKKLIIGAAMKFLLGVALVGALLFLPAGTLSWMHGWLLLGILFVPMLAVAIILVCKDPGLLKRRLGAKESSRAQSLVVKMSGLMFLAGFVVAGLGVRFGWYTLPKAVVIVGVVLFLMGYLLYGEVLRENTYLSRRIEVQEGQKVIDTGLYAHVRHPMYSATLLMFLSMPMVLGSVYAFLIFLAYPLIIVKRIKHEEEFLLHELTGYDAYMKKVKYRLIPFVW